MNEIRLTESATKELVSAAYDQGVEDGIRQERERIREAIAQTLATAEGNRWDGCPMVQSAYRQHADALIGLGALATEESEK